MFAKSNKKLKKIGIYILTIIYNLVAFKIYFTNNVSVKRRLQS